MIIAALPPMKSSTLFVLVNTSVFVQPFDLSAAYLPYESNLASLKILGYDPVQHAFINKLATYFSAAEIVETPNDGIGVNLNVDYPQNIYSTYFIF